MRDSAPHQDVISALDEAGWGGAEFADLTIEDFELEDGVDVAAITETWAVLQPQ